MSKMLIVYMYVLITGYGDGKQSYTRYEMPSMEACLKAVKNSKHIVSTGDESESTLSVFCATEKTHRLYNATWWIDEVKKH